MHNLPLYVDLLFKYRSKTNTSKETITKDHEFNIFQNGYLSRLGPYVSPIIPVGFRDWLSQRMTASLRASGPNVTYSDTVFGGVTVRVFADKQEGKDAAKRPAIVFYHGGGWSGGSVGKCHWYGVHSTLVW